MSKGVYIDQDFWEDPDVQRSSPAEKTLALFLMSNNRISISGIYRITVPTIAQNTGMTEAAVIEALSKQDGALKNIEYDFDASVVFIKNRLLYNHGGAKQLVLKGIARDMLRIKTSLWPSFRRTYPHVCEKIQEMYANELFPTRGSTREHKQQTQVRMEKLLDGIPTGTEQEIQQVIRFLPELLLSKFRSCLDQRFGPQGHAFEAALASLRRERSNGKEE